MGFLSQAAKYYKGEPHQTAAWDQLEKLIPPFIFDDFQKAYRNKPVATYSNPLKCAYFSQNDNASGTGYRECFSSSCAMLAAFHKKVTTDDEYNIRRASFGDSTDVNAQLDALASYSLKASFFTNGSVQDLKNEIDAGRPVAVGWLHTGPVEAPNGGGHWSVVHGYNDKGLYMLDPFGEARLISGNYVNHSGGNSVLYSYTNWVPRWEIEGKNTGWYLTCKP